MNLLRLLVIDDSDSDAELARRSLNPIANAIDFARVETSSELIDALTTQTWDLVLCDQMMPFLRMEDAIELVRSIDPRVPLILLSGSLTDVVQDRARRAGANACLSKDQMNLLVSAVRNQFN